jgi:predicted dehydrogenase
VVLDHRQVEAFPHIADPATRTPGSKHGETIPLLQQPKWAHAWLIEQFVQWLDGGPALETEAERNLQSVAMIFAAIESSRTGQPVLVQDMLDRTRNQVPAS